MDPHSLWPLAICRRGEGGGPAVVVAGGGGSGGRVARRETRGLPEFALSVRHSGVCKVSLPHVQLKP